MSAAAAEKRGPASAGPRPRGKLYNLPAADRRQIAYAFLGQRVRIVEDFFRDSNEEIHEGILVAVARPNTRGVADLAVIDVGPGSWQEAYSLATIARIELAPT